MGSHDHALQNGGHALKSKGVEVVINEDEQPSTVILNHGNALATRDIVSVVLRPFAALCSLHDFK